MKEKANKQKLYYFSFLFTYFQKKKGSTNVEGSCKQLMSSALRELSIISSLTNDGVEDRVASSYGKFSLLSFFIYLFLVAPFPSTQF